MNKAIDLLTAPKTRMWAYNLMIAIMGYLTVRGYLHSDETAALTAIGAALFAVASVNVDHTPGKHEAE